MTLCAAWIRKNGTEEELVMVTDSRLTGGESWDNGVKLFELPRQDCLLCFAGATARAYPLILNLISTIKFDQNLSNTHTDIHEVLDYLVSLFTDLVSEIKDAAVDLDQLRSEAEFLFGGWSWKDRQFGIWRLYYNPALSSFTHDSRNPNDARVFIFIGDQVEDAEILLENQLHEARKILAGTLDMEPMQVLAQMARGNNYSIGGALQIAKIYQSGTSEFFGVMWPSVTGHPTFMGRPIPPHDLPTVRIFDPDSALIQEDHLPDILVEIASNLEGCYGARLTGAGFGGCTVNLVNERNVDSFITSMKTKFREKVGESIDIYLCHASNGARIEEP